MSVTLNMISTIVNVRQHPNADRLMLADISDGTNKLATVIVGNTHMEGEIGIFFMCDAQLSEQYCEYNDLVARFDENGNKIPGSGFFDHKRRVKAQAFRGIKSPGLWMPIRSLEYIPFDLTYLKPGDSFEDGSYTLPDGETYEICRRYFTDKQLKNRALMMKAEKDAIARKFMPKVHTTEHIILNGRNIPEGDDVRYIMEEKWHGTSHVVGNPYSVIYTPKMRWTKGTRRPKVLCDVAYTNGIKHSTRNVFVTQDSVGYYGKESFRFEATRGINPKPGYIYYGEIVGWVGKDNPIMPTMDVPKELQDVYGKRMTFTYGYPNGRCGFHLYHIKHVNEYGLVRDLTWNEIVEIAESEGINKMLAWTSHSKTAQELVREVKEVGEHRTHGVWPDHITEGIVARVETPHGVEFFKYKNDTFCQFEGIREYSSREEES